MWMLISILSILAIVAWSLQRKPEPSPLEGEFVQAESSQVERFASSTSEVETYAESMNQVETYSHLMSEVEAPGKELEQLLDLGFAAKQAGQFTLAAKWFEKALKLKPEPDLAASLLADIYWLLRAGQGEETAKAQLSALWAEHQDRPGEAEKILFWLIQAGLTADDLLK